MKTWNMTISSKLGIVANTKDCYGKRESREVVLVSKSKLHECG